MTSLKTSTSAPLSIAKGVRPEAAALVRRLLGFRFAGFGCSSIELFFPVDPARAAAAVPHGFALLEEDSGEARIAFRVTRFELLLMDGTLASAAVMSEIGIRIAAPDRSPGSHFYLLSQVTSHAAVASRLRRPGFDTEALDSIVLRESGLGATGDQMVAARVPSADWPFSASARVVEALSRNGTATSAFWRVTGRGPICWRIQWNFVGSAAAVGRIRAPRGTPVSELVGRRSSVDATGRYTRFDAAGSVRRRAID